MGANSQFPNEQQESGDFGRQEDAFRAWITADGSSPYPVGAGRLSPLRILGMPVGPPDLDGP